MDKLLGLLGSAARFCVLAVAVLGLVGGGLCTLTSIPFGFADPMIWVVGLTALLFSAGCWFVIKVLRQSKKPDEPDHP